MDYLKKLKEQFMERDVDDEEEYEDDPAEVRSAAASPASPVPPRPAAVRAHASMPASQARPYTMIVVNPKDYKDAEKIGDHIKQGRPVVMNMEKTDQDAAERIVDFVQGVMYALDGHMDRISDLIYLCAPNNMTVSRESFTAYTGPAGDTVQSGPVGDVPQWNFPNPKA